MKRENALEFLSPTHLNGIVKVVTDVFLSLEKSDCERIVSIKKEETEFILLY